MTATIGPDSPAGTLFLASSAGVYGVLLAHAVRTRGVRVGLGAFFAFGLVAFLRDMIHVWVKGSIGYEFLLPFRLLGAAPLSFVGWTITSYLSWCLAESVAERSPFLRGKLFRTLAIAYVFGAAISIAVEPTGVALGIWRWKKLADDGILDFRGVIGFYGPVALVWGRFVVKILLMHWIFDASPLRRTRWRWIALAVPFVFPVGFLLGSAAGMLLPLAVLLVATLLPTQFDWPAPQPSGRRLAALPAAAALYMATLLGAIDVLVLGRWELAATKAPLALLVLAVAAGLIFAAKPADASLGTAAPPTRSDDLPRGRVRSA